MWLSVLSIASADGDSGRLVNPESRNLGDLIYTRIKVGEAGMVCVSVGQITTLVVMMMMTDDDDDDDYKSDGVCFRLQIMEAPLSDRMTPPVVEPNVVQLWRHF